LHTTNTVSKLRMPPNFTIRSVSVDPENQTGQSYNGPARSVGSAGIARLRDTVVK